MKSAEEAWAIVKRPFDFSEIEVKAQSVARDKAQALAVPYFNARAVMDRLDEAFGPGNWWTEKPETIHFGQAAGFTVGLSVRYTSDDGETRTNTFWEVAEASDIEPIKGAFSGALKRCFSTLGNRTLYSIKLGWFECEKSDAGKFQKWTHQTLQLMRTKYEKQINDQFPRGDKNKIPAGKPNEVKAPANVSLEVQPGGKSGATEHQEMLAKKFLAEVIGLKTRKQFNDFVDGLKGFHIPWVDMCLCAAEDGVLTYDDLVAFIAGKKQQKEVANVN